MLISIAEIVVAALLIGVILLQMQGTGLSSSFGGSGEFYRSRRSIEKLLLYLTIILSVAFGLISVLLLISR
ncbi:MAG: Preprotein translocase, SecG subunit [Candidatus Levybacteria bacterium GW2011_GWA2_36_13]|nr:MAG: Preprotein translocase, SecG subunit [Candidatus Levybacteria bacterium GW2011_GWA2_36_13]OGH44324.1 MAG: preprotein translocase subunit SecG [Candidatus Levybacteria bacterium RIFCSPLOWO2_02_FULL_37_11]